MSIHQLLLILRARWRLCLLIWAGVFASVLTFNLLSPSQFTSTAVVVVDGKAFDLMSGSQAASNGPSPGFMATQIDIAQSERVVVRAARALGLEQDAKWRAQWQVATQGRGDYMAWVAEQLQRRIAVRPSRDSSALGLFFTDRDPVFAARAADSLMHAYIDTTLDMRVEPARQFNTFFDGRASQLREQLEKAQTRLSAYQRDNGLLSTDERFDVENARLQELSSQVVLMQNLAADTSSRSAEATTSPDRLPEVLNSPLISSLTTDLSRSEARLQELRSRLGERHPSVMEAEASVNEVRGRLTSAKQSAVGSVIGANKVNVSRLEQARGELEKQRSRVLQSKAKRDEAAVLQRDVENAQRAYDATLARVSQTDMESQNRQTNVSVLQEASTPTAPSSPRILLNSATAFVLGALLAIGAVLSREMADRRIRSEEDVTQGLGQLLLTTLPRTVFDGRKSLSNAELQKRRVLNGSAALARIK